MALLLLISWTPADADLQQGESHTPGCCGSCCARGLLVPAGRAAASCWTVGASWFAEQSSVTDGTDLQQRTQRVRMHACDEQLGASQCGRVAPTTHCNKVPAHIHLCMHVVLLPHTYEVHSWASGWEGLTVAAETLRLHDAAPAHVLRSLSNLLTPTSLPPAA